MIPFLKQPLAFVDLETTGANAQRDRITEIGVVEWDGERISEWSTLVNPKTPIPSFIQSLTGINDTMVSQAPTFEELAPGVLERLEGRVFFAHNARFDYGFLKNEFKRAGLDFRANVVCTVKLSRRLFPREFKHNLDAVTARMGLCADGDRHRALTDAQLIQRFVAKLSQTVDEETLAQAFADVTRQATLPPRLDPEQIETIPDGHGVYIFYGENNIPIYVGKSNNLKKRVLSHFSSDHQADREMQLSRQLTRVEWISTAGELGAVLTESRLIKSLRPIYNRQLRQNDDVCSWRFTANADGNAKPELVMACDQHPGYLQDMFGLYRSAREATSTMKKLAEGNKLCMVTLGLERTGKRERTPCFGMQVGKCRGACVGKESLLTHQARFLALMTKVKVERWPWPGRIAVKDGDAATAAFDWHILDHWDYLGTATDEQQLEAILQTRHEPKFDLDTYRILSKWIKHAKPENIRVIEVTSTEIEG